jgi:hypothetical protein
MVCTRISTVQQSDGWEPMNTFSSSGRFSLYIVCIVLLAVPCCRQAEPVPISLLDQVNPLEPLGPWRLAADIRGLRSWTDGAEGLGLVIEGRLIEARLVAELKPRQLKLASRVMEKGGAFVQTAPVSTHRQALVAEPGEHVLVGLRYGAACTDSPRVEARLTRAGEAVASTEAVVDGHWCETRLTVPPGGIEMLEIRHHLAPGTALPLKNATVLVVESAAPEEEISRALSFLRLARGDRPFPVARISERRVFPLQMAGRTLDTLLLGSGESIELAVPPALAGRRLLCRLAVLDGGQSAPAAFTLESETGEGWRSLARLPVRAEDAGTWAEVSLEKTGGGRLPPASTLPGGRRGHCRSVGAGLSSGAAAAGP